MEYLCMCVCVCVCVCVCASVTFFQWQQGDCHTQPPAAQAHQMWSGSLDLQPLPCVDQVQRRRLQALVRVERSFSHTVYFISVYYS